MKTDGLECLNSSCHAWDDSFECSCSMRVEPDVEACEDYQPYDGPSKFTRQAIQTEVRNARHRFPHNRHLLGALMEEVGELAQALLEGKSRHEIQKEAVHVACVAIRIIEEGDADYGGWTAEDGRAKKK